MLEKGAIVQVDLIPITERKEQQLCENFLGLGDSVSRDGIYTHGILDTASWYISQVNSK